MTPRAAQSCPMSTVRTRPSMPEWLRQGQRMAYSGLIFAARITLPHFSVSSAMKLLNSVGVEA
jgi:hypothetical protein